MATLRLSATQKSVLKWLGRGWTTAPGAGSTLTVNGAKLCTVSTMEALQRMGMVEPILNSEGKPAPGQWKATPDGKQLTSTLGL